MMPVMTTDPILIFASVARIRKCRSPNSANSAWFGYFFLPFTLHRSPAGFFIAREAVMR
jgi:hypothetical protein